MEPRRHNGVSKFKSLRPTQVCCGRGTGRAPAFPAALMRRPGEVADIGRCASSAIDLNGRIERSDRHSTETPNGQLTGAGKRCLSPPPDRSVSGPASPRLVPPCLADRAAGRAGPVSFHHGARAGLTATSPAAVGKGRLTFAAPSRSGQGGPRHGGHRQPAFTRRPSPRLRKGRENGGRGRERWVGEL